MKLRITKRHIIRFLQRLGIVAVALFLLFLLLNWFFPLPDKIEYSTIVTDNKGEVINAYLTSDQKWRMKTELDEISPLLKKTIIAKEDKYFYSHPGVNPFAVTRAFFKNIFRMKRTSGASTITMQVARALEPKKRNVLSKIIEMFRAFQLEWKYSKDEILQMYLNLVPYGGNIEGVKSASILYFNKKSILPENPVTCYISHKAKISELTKKLRNLYNEKTVNLLDIRNIRL